MLPGACWSNQLHGMGQTGTVKALYMAESSYSKLDVSTPGRKQGPWLQEEQSVP